jgi:hypothetical protein
MLKNIFFIAEPRLSADDTLATILPFCLIIKYFILDLLDSFRQGKPTKLLPKHA